MGPSTTQQLFCQGQLGERRSSEIINLIEKTDGKPCPCKRGLVCPLAPVAGPLLQLEPFRDAG